MDTIPDAIIPPRIQVDPSLRTITPGVPPDDTIDAPVPEVRATTEERFRDFDTSSVTHVVIQVTIARQADIFRSIGYQYNWDQPTVFWHFLGKMVAKALLDSTTELGHLSYVAVGRREFVGYTTSLWRAAGEAQEAGVAELPPYSVIEVNFKKPQPGQPLEFTWAPAREVFTANIRQWSERSDKDYIRDPGVKE